METSGSPGTLAEPSLSTRILDQMDAIVSEAETATKPLEIEPYRGRMFELFVTAEGAGYVSDQAEVDLTADGLCHSLSERWGLKKAAQQSIDERSILPTAELQKMRSLWSVMRMWMEWSYAWSRWPEFHGRATS